MLSHIFVLTADTKEIILSRSYRSRTDIQTLIKIFSASLHSTTPPIFNKNEHVFGWILRSAIIFGCVIDKEVVFNRKKKFTSSPSTVLCILDQFSTLCRNVCGSLYYASLENNLVVLYEILDEILDCGLPQSTTASLLKQCIHTTPNSGNSYLDQVADEFKENAFVLSDINGNFQKSNTFNYYGHEENENEDGDDEDGGNEAVTTYANTQKRGLQHQNRNRNSVVKILPGYVDLPLCGIQKNNLLGGGDPNNEQNKNDLESINSIYVDIVERLTILIASNGEIKLQELCGQINLNSGLNENTTIAMVLDRDFYSAEPFGLRFHSSVNYETYQTSKVLRFTSERGTITLLKYRLNNFALPFSVVITRENNANDKNFDVCLSIRVKANFPHTKTTTFFRLSFFVSSLTDACDADLLTREEKDNCDYDHDTNEVYWTINCFKGGTEQILRLRLKLNNSTNDYKDNLFGPFKLDFEIGKYLCSPARISQLQATLANQNSYTPQKWVRYVTFSDSYLFRT